jgi:hypothetical protein
MNVETGAEAAQLQEKEYINGIAVAVFLFVCRVLTQFSWDNTFNFWTCQIFIYLLHFTIHSIVHVGQNSIIPILFNK